MTIETPAIVIPSPRRGPGRHRRLIGLAGVLTVAGAVAVAGGLWQAHRDGGTRIATPPDVAVEQPTAARTVERVPIYYLVGTAAEAAVLRALVAQLGTPPLPEVVTAATDADADTFFWAMAEEYGFRASPGLPRLTVVDLRQPAASTPTSTTASTGVWAERYAEPLAGAGTGPIAPVTVDTMGGMAELYRERQAAAAEHDRTRGICDEAAQPQAC